MKWVLDHDRRWLAGREEPPMGHRSSRCRRVGRASLLDEIVRDGARQMLAAALRAEVSGASRTQGRATTTGNGQARLAPSVAASTLLEVWMLHDDLTMDYLAEAIPFLLRYHARRLPTARLIVPHD
jgi:hypothetical protein